MGVSEVFCTDLLVQWYETLVALMEGLLMRGILISLL